MSFPIEIDGTEDQLMDVVLKTHFGRLDRFIVQIDDEEIGEIGFQEDVPGQGGFWYYIANREAILVQPNSQPAAIFELWKATKTFEDLARVEPDQTDDNDLPF